MHFAYAFGLSYLGSAYQRGGAAEVEQASRPGPETTRQILAGYRPDAEEFLFEDMSDVARPLLPDAWTLVHVERAGAFLFELLRQRQKYEQAGVEPASPRPWPDPDNTGWSGDSLSVYRDEAGKLRLYWRVRFETAAHAENAREYLDNATWQVELRERDVIVSAASRGVDTSQIYDEWGPAPDAGPEPMQDQNAAIRCMR